jgi:hypothetical protein
MHVIAEKIKKQKEILFISSLGDIQEEDSEICMYFTSGYKTDTGQTNNRT